MEVRLANEEDAEEVAEMWYKLGLMMEPYSEINVLKENALETAKDGFRERIAEEEMTIFLMVENDDPLGYISCSEVPHSTRVMEKELKIIDLYVEESYRGDGLGTELIEKAIQYGRQNDCEYIQVSAETQNKKALDFYLDKKFEEKQVTLTREL